MPEVTRTAEPTASRRRVYFVCVDTADMKTRLQASDMSTFTVKISKDGAAPVTPATATITELDATNMKGVFYWDGAAADWTGVDKLVLKVSNAGGTKVMEPREIVSQVTPEDPYRPSYFGNVVAGTLSTTVFTTDRTETTTDLFKDDLIEFLTGPNAGAGGKKIGGYTGSGTVGTFTLATGQTLPVAPAATDKFRIITR